jgi:hypothetical protein
LHGGKKESQRVANEIFNGLSESNVQKRNIEQLMQDAGNAGGVQYRSEAS